MVSPLGIKHQRKEKKKKNSDKEGFFLVGIIMCEYDKHINLTHCQWGA